MASVFGKHNLLLGGRDLSYNNSLDGGARDVNFRAGDCLLSEGSRANLKTEQSLQALISTMQWIFG